MRPAVFLDRDGTIIEDVGFLRRAEAMTLLPGADRSIRQLNDAGFAVVVVSNQSGIGRGLFDESFVRATHAALDARLEEAGARIDAYYYCPHHPDAPEPKYQTSCDCRKPAPGLVLQAAADLDLDLGRSWMVGDRWRDVECGARAGCRGILVKTGYGTEEATLMPPDGIRADAILKDLMEAVEWILRTSSR